MIPLAHVREYLEKTAKTGTGKRVFRFIWKHPTLRGGAIALGAIGAGAAGIGLAKQIYEPVQLINEERKRGILRGQTRLLQDMAASLNSMAPKPEPQRQKIIVPPLA